MNALKFEVSLALTGELWPVGGARRKVRRPQRRKYKFLSCFLAAPEFDESTVLH